MVALHNTGRNDEARKEFEELSRHFAGTRQALNQRLQYFAEFSCRPCLSDGTPVRTMGWKLLKRLKQEHPDVSEWIPEILKELVEKKRIASVCQALEWILDVKMPTPEKKRK